MRADTTDGTDGTAGGHGGRWAVRAIAALALVLLVLGATVGAAGAAGVGRTAVIDVAHDRDDDEAPRWTRLEPVTKPGDRPDGRSPRGGEEDSFDRALDRGRDLLDRYGSETIVRAVVVGALVQVLCLVLFRLIGTVLRLVARGFAMTIGVVVALSLLGGTASLPVSGGEAAEWLGRLANLTDLVA